MKKMFQSLKNAILQTCWEADWLKKTIEEQKAFLSSLPEPADDMERSYLQYKCFCFFRKPWQVFLMNCAALPPLMIHPLLFRRRRITPEPHSDAVFLCRAYRDIEPLSLREEFPKMQPMTDPKKYRYLSKDDVRFLRELRRRYPLSFFFRYECMSRVALSSGLIACYNPKALIATQQGDFTASYASSYCAARGVEHICIMHGIRFYSIEHSFLRFDRFYVWNAFFKDMFMESRVARDQLKIEVPLSLRFPRTTSELEPVDCTYYLQNQTLPQVQAIGECLLRLKRAGARIAVRPHPAHRECVKPLAESGYGFIVEDPDQVPIEDSILRTKYAIAFYSTTLVQGYYNGRTPVIDDVNAPEYFAGLKESGYTNQFTSYKLLSELLEEIEGGGKISR